MKLLTNKQLNTIKGLFVITDKDRKIFKKELGVIRILTSLLSFSFLFFFLFLNKIHYETVLFIYTILTADFFKVPVVFLSVYIFIGSIILRNFTYVFAMCLFLFGQFLFVYVLDDDYSIDQKRPENMYEKSKGIKIHYSPYWNMG